MKYLTSIRESISKARVHKGCYIFSKWCSAFDYLEYNYKSHPPASNQGNTDRRLFSRFSRASKALRIVHNLCINWQ